jgi:hypothetical protein
MAFKIADAFVSVSPDDTGFEADLRNKVSAAADSVKAEVGLQLHGDADLVLSEDVHAAIDAATAGVTADVGLTLKDDAVEKLDADVKAGVALVGDENKVKVGIDGKAAQDAGQQGGGLIMAGILAGTAVGAPALLAGLGTVFVGIDALALKSNATIAASYTQLGKDASDALTQATAPLAGTMLQAVDSLDATVNSLGPDLRNLFAASEPDITAVTQGIESFTTSALPGLSQALQASQVDVQDVAHALGPLGSSVGSFFTGLTTDANLTGAGLQSVLGVAGNVISTLGSVLGSASAAVSADLIGLAPVINGTLTAVQALASPATVGGLAGAFGAMKLDPAISSGLKSASSGMFDLASKTENATGVLGKVSGAALAGSTGLEKMSNLMGGPWGIAVGAGVGLLSGLAGMLWESAHASDAVTLSQQGLQDAVSKDAGAAGQATAAYVAAQSQANGVAKSAADAGVSLQTWTEAVLGNKQAQDQVIASVNTANQVIDNQKLAADEGAKQTGKYSGELQDAQTAADGAAAASNRYTTENQKLINSLYAEQKQVADAISKQTDYEKAMNAVTNTESLFNASLTAAHQQLVANAQSQALTTIGALNLGNANYALTSSLDASVTAYNLAQTEGNAYLSVLTALNGGEAALLGTEAAFTTSLSQLTTAVKANGTSLDVNNAKGAANITTLTNIASAADKAAGAVYQNEVQTKGATQAYNDANAKLAQEKQAFIDAADKAGFNKQQVQQLADELFKLPKNVQVGANVQPALYGLSTLLGRINSSSGTVTVYETTSGSVGSTQTKVTAHAGGGFAPYTEPAIFGEEGPEIGYPVQGGMQIIPAAQTRQILGAASAGGNAGALGGTTVKVDQHFYGSSLPNIEQRATMRRELASLAGV